MLRGPALHQRLSPREAKHAWNGRRYPVDYEHENNAGLEPLVVAVRDLKAQWPCITFADIVTLGSAVAVEAAGGERSAMHTCHCRVDLAVLPDSHDALQLASTASSTTGADRMPCPGCPAGAQLACLWCSGAGNISNMSVQ